MRDDDENISTVTASNSTMTLSHDGEEHGKESRQFRNIGREYFERVRQEWTKQITIAQDSSVDSSSSSSVPYDRLVKIFIASVNGNRNTTLPQPLSLVDAVEILSAAWESDAGSYSD
jgi:hypothetical protein